MNSNASTLLKSVPRRAFIVLSPVSLDYARHCIQALFSNSTEQVHLHLITDSVEDRQELIEGLDLDCFRGEHLGSVYAQDDLADLEADRFAAYPNLRQFRHGHPCWRKITDPILLSQDGEEMILLDPDLYFPNRFAFEPTPAHGVLLMWQQPTCLMRPDQILLAMEKGIRLADHVDIGVGAWRAPVDLDWIEWLLRQLDFKSLRRYMHMEAFVWAALAMRIGGGYLDPKLWHCWNFSQPRRILLKMGIPGTRLLGSQHFSQLKCFHAGGQAKYWLDEAKRKGLLDSRQSRILPGRILPFKELLPISYHREMRFKQVLGRLGYYSVFRHY
jgi:hypothetical protein